MKTASGPVSVSDASRFRRATSSALTAVVIVFLAHRRRRHRHRRGRPLPAPEHRGARQRVVRGHRQRAVGHRARCRARIARRGHGRLAGGRNAPGAVRRTGSAADGARRRAAARAARRRNGRRGWPQAAQTESEAASRMKDEFLGTDLARAAHAAQRGARLAAPDQDGQAGRGHRAARLRIDRAERPAPGAAHRRSARHVEGADRALRLDVRAVSLDDGVCGSDVAGLAARRRRRTSRSNVNAARGAGRRARRRKPPAPGRVAPARERDQVHAARRQHRRHARVQRPRRASRCATPVPASTRSSCRASSIASRRRIRRRRARRADSASGCRWFASWSSGTAATSGSANAKDGGAMFTIRLPLHRGDQAQTTVAAGGGLADGQLAAAERRARAAARSGPGRARAAERRAAAARRLGPSAPARSTRRSRCSSRGGPTCWSATRRRRNVTPTPLVGKVQSLEAERGGRIPALALTNMARTDEGMRRMLSGRETRSAQAGGAGGPDRGDRPIDGTGARGAPRR